MQINAFNFPVWGMLEKLAPGVPGRGARLVKPASPTRYLAEAVVEGDRSTPASSRRSLQLSAGGSREPARSPRRTVTPSHSPAPPSTAATVEARHRSVNEHVSASAPEADSLNSSMLGPDAAPGSPDSTCFIKEVTEMTAKAGQKYTAIRRTFVPEDTAPRRDRRASAKRSPRPSSSATPRRRRPDGRSAGRAQVSTCRREMCRANRQGHRARLRPVRGLRRRRRRSG